MRPTRSGAVMLLGILLLMGQTWAQGEDVLRTTGEPVDRSGICIVAGDEDGKLAVELAQKTRYFVFALTGSEEACDRVRQALDAAGLYGKRATAMPGSLKGLPFPRGYGNLIVTGRYLPELSLKEVGRVLNPNGVALIAGVATNGAALEAALKQSGITQYKLSSGYAVISGRMPEGSDDWTHWRRRPDNLPVSSDPSIRPPLLTQWIMLPGHGSADAVTVVSKGRVILKNNLQGYGQTPKIYARDSFNGTPLWERQLEVPTSVQGGVALVEDRFYFIDGAKCVRVLDAATGREIRTYEPPKGTPVEGARLIRLAVYEGTLYLQADKSPEKPYHSLGDTFFALGLDDGALKWSYTCEQRAQEGSVVFGDKAVFFYAPGLGAAALELSSGKERWKNTTEAVKLLGKGFIGQFVSAGANWSTYHDGKVYYFSAGPLTALDSRTGKVLWNVLVRRPLLTDGKIYTYGRGANALGILDPATGKSTGSLTLPGRMSGCGSGTATPSCIYSSGQGFSMYDLPTKKWYAYTVFRTPCANGSIFANGMAYTTPTTCGCNYSVTAAVALAPMGEGWQVPDGGKDLESRFVKGSAYGAPLAADDAGDDWPSYRHDPRHSAVTQSTPQLPLKLTWQQRLTGDLTSPSTGDGLVYVGSSDGHVWALDAADGSIRWKFLSGADVPVTPTFHRGRVLFGSHDGWVYCLEAKTGRLAWKFRAAPEERYVNVLGQMMSTWPVQTGVVVTGGTAYFAAGMCAYDGAYLYAMEVTTGRLLWAKQIGHLDEFGGGVSPQGAMALSDDVLFIPCGGSHPAAFRKKDGSVLWWSGTLAKISAVVKYGYFGKSGGSEIVVEGDALLVGGPRLIGDFAYPFIMRNAESGAPYGTQEAAKTGKIVRSAGGFVSEYFIPPPYGDGVGRLTPLLTGDRIFFGGAACDREKMARLHLVSRENWGKGLAEAKLWSAKFPADVRSMALAGWTLLVGGRAEVAALDTREDNKELGRIAVPGAVRSNGLAVSKGKVYVVTDKGSVLCVN